MPKLCYRTEPAVDRMMTEASARWVVTLLGEMSPGLCNECALVAFRPGRPGWHRARCVGVSVPGTCPSNDRR